MRISVDVKGKEDLVKKLRQMAKGGDEAKGVKVGVMDSARYPSQRKKGRPQSKKPPPYVAQVAFWNEFGVRKGSWGPIPERPLLRDSADKIFDNPNVKIAIDAITNPKNPGFSEKIANNIGVAAQGVIQEQFEVGKYKPNSEVTVYFKTGGKGGKTTPLIDDGLYRRSITYQIIK